MQVLHALLLGTGHFLIEPERGRLNPLEYLHEWEQVAWGWNDRQIRLWEFLDHSTHGSIQPVALDQEMCWFIFAALGRNLVSLGWRQLQPIVVRAHAE